jgi:hypothetical protein
MYTEDDRNAIQIMAHAADRVIADLVTPKFERFRAVKILHHAIRHLAYPDRDVYPKVRGSKKGAPVVRRRQ